MARRNCNREFHCSRKTDAEYRKTAYDKKCNNGCCVVCGKETKTELARCTECNARSNLKNQERRAKLTAEGKCRDCGGEAQLTNRSLRGRERGNYCGDCWLKMLATSLLGSRKLWKILLDKLEACGWKCPYTGETLVIGVNLSFDHMDPICRFPEKQHDPNNIEPISWQVNLMKRDLTKSEFLEKIKRIYEHGVH